MKKLIYTLPLIVFLVVSYGFIKLNSSDSDQSPFIIDNSNNEFNYTSTDTTPPAGFPFPTKFNFNYATVTNMNAGTVGALLLFGKYYFNRWNSTATYVYNNAGANGGPGVMTHTLTYVGSCRDLTTNGRYIYGGPATSTLYKFDTNMTIVSTFSLGAITRAVAYDYNRNGFWAANWSDPITCKDSTGATLRTFGTGTMTSKYGFGMDSLLSNDSAYVWVWNQNSTSANGLGKFYITSGTMVASYVFNHPVNVGIAGGAEVVRVPGTPDELWLLCNWQNYALTGYKMKDILTWYENNNELVQDFKLAQNYPNPFNPSTTISFMLMKAGQVKLEVFDAAGSHVKTILNAYQTAGDHKIVFNGDNLSSGIYFYTITAGDFTQTKKMMLIK